MLRCWMVHLSLGVLLLTGWAAPVKADKWALLIGINNYTIGPAHWDLKGCENDVAMTKAVLVDKFGFPEENIKTLVSDEATAQAIVEAIEDWLIARTKPEDIVYFHFSGHGAQVADREGDEVDDGKDELICPTNMQRGDRTSIITDDQLSDLFNRIPANNTTIIIDACHSGTGTRDISRSRPRFVEFELEAEADDERAVILTPVAAKPEIKPEAPPEAPTPKPEESSAAEEPSLPSEPEESVSQLSLPAPPKNKLSGSGGMESNRKLQVMISGCKPDQTSADAWIREGVYAGALTYNLVENMKKAPADITYRALMEQVVRDVKAQKYTQTPLIEGDMDRPLFGTVIEGVQETPFLVVEAVEAEGVRLNGGKLQNVTPGSMYGLFPAGEKRFEGEGIGRLKVVEVGQTTSSAQLLDPVQVLPGFRAKEILHSVGVDKLKLILEAENVDLASQIQASLVAVDFVRIVDSGQYFDHRLQVISSQWGLQAALTVDGVPEAPVVGADADDLVRQLKPQLENAYAIKYLANLDNPNPPFQVDVWANRSDSDQALDQAPDEKLVQATIGDLIRFNFRAERDCYLTLINVGTSGKITVLFPNQYRPDGFIEAGKIYRTETRGEMPFQIRARAPAGRELVKVIATLDPLDLSSLRMGEAGGAGTRSISSGSSFAIQLARDLAVERIDAEVDLLLLPTEKWVTDYLIIETAAAE